VSVLANDYIIGDSAPIRHLRQLIRIAAQSKLSVLIQGPTGAGKELVAQSLHAASGRRGRIVAFNVCAISESMFEDTLFGHVRGAFTGATSDRDGFLREANGGTVFLDEVSGLDFAMQAKLLRAVETGEFRPVGARADAASDFRVVAATNEDVATLVRDGRFRADLAHRLSGVILRVPALDERREDVPRLALHFATLAGIPTERVTDAALSMLRERTWPGNVRELRQVVEWAGMIGEQTLTVSAVEQALSTRISHSAYAVSREDEQRRELHELLSRHRWDVQLVSDALQVHKATLYRRMKRLGLIGDRAHSPGPARYA
jgi:two-component system NtrC family response regulator